MSMDTVALLRVLVGFDTVSDRSNLPLILWVANFLEAHGATVQLVHSDDGQKANLLARIGPARDGGIVLSGHTDVVPVAGQDWQSDPFALHTRDGRLYGRGAADMKGFIAACLAAVPRWRDLDPRRPVHLALSYDEEVGCLGVPRLIAALPAHAPRPALAIIGEPTSMRVGLAHRGFYGQRTRFRGRPAHSSDPARGANAIVPAARLVGHLACLGHARWAGMTVNVGRIAGGTAVNIVAEHCDLVWEFRPEDAAGAAAMQAEVARFLGIAAGDVAVETETLATVPALERGRDAGVVALVRELGALWPPAELAFGTEAGFFQRAGIPAVVCGPGSIAQAHQPDEWIAASQLLAADRFMGRIGVWASSAP